MMSEKYTYRGSTVYERGAELSAIDIVDSLNKQQNMIENLTKENDNCRNDYHELFSNYVALEEENEQLKQEHKIAIDEMITDYKNLEKKNGQLQKEKEYYREYALQYLLEYDLYTDNFLNDIKDIIGEEGVKRIKEKQNKIIEALKKEGLYK